MTTLRTNSRSASKKAASSALGAPSQLKQPSRKGKRAWRKNVDLQDLEETLEGLREEERITGSYLHNKKDEELFQIDLEGDNKVRKSLPRFAKSQLTSTKIISRRSAVPAVLSRTTPSSTKRKSGVTTAEKARLLRLAKKPLKGPFNSVLISDDKVLEVTEAVKTSGTYDPWAEKEISSVEETHPAMKRVPKAPSVPHPRSFIELPAVEEPHQGISYNPVDQAHQNLLLEAHTIEAKRIQAEKKLSDFVEKMERAQLRADEDFEGVPPGMTVDLDEEVMDVADQDEAENLVSRPLPERKTKQQRKKAAKLRAEKRALVTRVARKRLLASVSSIKSERRRAEQALLHHEEACTRRRSAKLLRLKGGLGGTKIGKSRVPEGDVTVQLGEDLSESLRELKPEGNLFRERLLSLQRRALVEPRALILAKRVKKMKEYEKHPWKRFDRYQ